MSEKAYGAVAYIQTINNGNASCIHNKRLELEASSRKLKQQSAISRYGVIQQLY